MSEDLKKDVSGSLLRTKHLVEIGSGLATMIAFLCGGIWAGIQYDEHKKETAITRTLQYVQRYNTGEIAEHRSQLERNWDREIEVIKKILTDESKESSQRQKEFGEKLGGIVGKDYPSFFKLVGFFEEVTTCALAGICSEEKTHEFFDSDVGIFVKNYSPFICSTRKKYFNPSFGKRMIEYFYEPYYELSSADFCD